MWRHFAPIWAKRGILHICQTEWPRDIRIFTQTNFRTVNSTMKSVFKYFYNLTLLWRHCTLIWAKWAFLISAERNVLETSKFSCWLIWRRGIQKWCQFLNILESDSHYDVTALFGQKGAFLKSAQRKYARDIEISRHTNSRMWNSKMK